jgi:ABC-type cobalt transport system, periplasmic component
MSIKVEYILIAVLVIFGAIFVCQTFILDSEFGGADGEADDLISEINPDYEPWFDPIWEPPGGETESLLFCLQGAFGALIIGWFFGYYHAMNKLKKASKKA